MYAVAGDGSWYFFTQRNRKYPNGKRPNRAAGDGFWKATSAEKPITYEGRVVGYKTALVYFRGDHSGGTKSDWSMYEYKLHKASHQPRRPHSHSMKLEDWVLCKIYKNARAQRKRKNDQHDNDAIPTMNEAERERETIPCSALQPYPMPMDRPIMMATPPLLSHPNDAFQPHSMTSNCIISDPLPPALPLDHQSGMINVTTNPPVVEDLDWILCEINEEPSEWIYDNGDESDMEFEIPTGTEAAVDPVIPTFESAPDHYMTETPDVDNFTEFADLLSSINWNSIDDAYNANLTTHFQPLDRAPSQAQAPVRTSTPNFNQNVDVPFNPSSCRWNRMD